MKIETLKKHGFRPVSFNTGKITRQVVGSLLSTKGGQLYVSEISIIPRQSDGRMSYEYGKPQLIGGFRVTTRKGLQKMLTALEMEKLISERPKFGCNKAE